MNLIILSFGISKKNYIDRNQNSIYFLRVEIEWKVNEGIFWSEWKCFIFLLGCQLYVDMYFLEFIEFVFLLYKLYVNLE